MKTIHELISDHRSARTLGAHPLLWGIIGAVSFLLWPGPKGFQPSLVLFAWASFTSLFYCAWGCGVLWDSFKEESSGGGPLGVRLKSRRNVPTSRARW